MHRTLTALFWAAALAWWSPAAGQTSQSRIQPPTPPPAVITPLQVKADLRISNIVIQRYTSLGFMDGARVHTDGAVPANQRFDVCFNVHNDGGTNARDYQVSGSRIGRAAPVDDGPWVNANEVGHACLIYLHGTPSLGIHEITVRLDAHDDIDELREDNNEARIAVRITPAH